MNNDTFQWTDELVKEFETWREEFFFRYHQDLSKWHRKSEPFVYNANPCRPYSFADLCILFKQSKMPKTERPPLIGLPPEWMWKEMRVDELCAAISRWELADKEVPKEWSDELNELNTWIANRKNGESKKEWEIVSVTEGFGSYVDVDKNGKVRYAHFSDCSVEDALQNRGYKIRSVRRLSDNEVFTVGDEVEYRSADASDWGDICGYGTINWFKISLVYKSRMEVEINDEHRWRDAYFPHKYIENIRHKKPQPKKERIEVTHASTGDTTMTLYFSGVIPYGKYNEIKFAVEKVFNNER